MGSLLMIVICALFDYAQRDRHDKRVFLSEVEGRLCGNERCYSGSLLMIIICALFDYAQRDRHDKRVLLSEVEGRLKVMKGALRLRFKGQRVKL